MHRPWQAACYYEILLHVLLLPNPCTVVKTLSLRFGVCRRCRGVSALTLPDCGESGDHADQSNKPLHEVGGQAVADPDDASDSDPEDEDVSWMKLCFSAICSGVMLEYLPCEVVGDLPSWSQSLERPSISTLSVGSWSTTKHESHQARQWRCCCIHELLFFDSVGCMLEWIVIEAVHVRMKGSGAVMRTKPVDLQAFALLKGPVSYS